MFKIMHNDQIKNGDLKENLYKAASFYDLF